MLYHAAVALSRMTTSEELAAGRVFPALDGIRDVSLQVQLTLMHSPQQPMCTAAMHILPSIIVIRIVEVLRLSSPAGGHSCC